MRKLIPIIMTLLVVVAGCLGGGANPANSTKTKTGTLKPKVLSTNTADDHSFLAILYPSLKGELEENVLVSRSHPEAAYTVHVFARIARKRPLTPAELRILEITLKANDCYFSHNVPPNRSYYVVAFSRERPIESIPYVKCQNFTSTLPFVYYRGEGFQYYPVTASNWAYHYLKTGGVKKARELLDEMLPLMETVNTPEGKGGVFRVYFSPPGGSPIPWVSSFSQGMLAGLYAWLYNETGNETYLNTSKMLFNSFYIPLREGGFVEKSKYGIWFLEYPYRPSFLVLNGHIITMKGLWYYYRFTGDKRALELFLEGVESVRKALPHYDTGNWSLYSVNGPKAREDYHRLHIRLLLWLYSKTGDRTFLSYAEKWNGYLEKRGLKKENIRELLKEMRNSP